MSVWHRRTRRGAGGQLPPPPDSGKKVPKIRANHEKFGQTRKRCVDKQLKKLSYNNKKNLLKKFRAPAARYIFLSVIILMESNKQNLYIRYADIYVGYKKTILVIESLALYIMTSECETKIKALLTLQFFMINNICTSSR